MSKDAIKLTSDKIHVLTSQLDERYNAMHIIRERAQNLSIWVLGLFATASGWLVQSKIDLDYKAKLIISIMVILVYAVLRLYYLKDLQKGFAGQQKVAANIENKLGLYSTNIYGEESVLPLSWKKSGEKKSDGNFFNTIFVLVGIGVLILLFGILVQGRF